MRLADGLYRIWVRVQGSNHYQWMMIDADTAQWYMEHGVKTVPTEDVDDAAQILMSSIDNHATARVEDTEEQKKLRTAMRQCVREYMYMPDTATRDEKALKVSELTMIQEKLQSLEEVKRKKLPEIEKFEQEMKDFDDSDISPLS